MYRHLAAFALRDALRAVADLQPSGRALRRVLDAHPSLRSRAAAPCVRLHSQATAVYSDRAPSPAPPDAWHTAVRHLRSGSFAQSAPSAPSPATKDADTEVKSATPEDCDRIVAELRYRNIPIPSELDISIGRRVQFLIKGVWDTAVAALRFVVSIPGGILSLSRMSLTEWREMLSGWWASLKHEVKHYWAGFKLFGFEIRVASRLVWKQLQGQTLTRRERKQLTTTTADIFRMVPFTLFIIIPFAEVLLPVALRLFPNMLPSTFQTQLKQEEDTKKLLKLKTELARFLQQTVAEVAKDVKSSSSGAVRADAKALYGFLKDVRAGKAVSNKDIIQFATLFNDELTLDNLDRVHLVTLCQFLSLNALGTAAFLRMRLRAHLNEIKADDIEISVEGVEDLTDDELRQACRARGMAAPFGAGCTAFMQRQLREWIELSLDKNIAPSLLLLSRAFKITNASAAHKKAQRKADAVLDSSSVAVEDLKNTFNMLPEETIEDVEMERFKSGTSLEKRLEYLQRVEQEIQEENSTEKELSSEREALVESQQRLDIVQAKARVTAKAMVRSATARALRDVLDSGLAEGESDEEQVFRAAKQKEKRMRKLLSSLVTLASASGVSQERSLFMEVAKTEVDSIINKMNSRGGSYVVFTGSGIESVRPDGEQVKTDKVTQQVSSRVKKMLIRIEEDLDRAESAIGGRLHLLDTDSDGVISRDELKEALNFLQEELSEEEMQQLQKMLGNSDLITVSKLEELRANIDAGAVKE